MLGRGRQTAFRGDRLDRRDVRHEPAHAVLILLDDHTTLAHLPAVTLGRADRVEPIDQGPQPASEGRRRTRQRPLRRRLIDQPHRLTLEIELFLRCTEIGTHPCQSADGATDEIHRHEAIPGLLPQQRQMRHRLLCREKHTTHVVLRAPQPQRDVEDRRTLRLAQRILVRPMHVHLGIAARQSDSIRNPHRPPRLIPIQIDIRTLQIIQRRLHEERGITRPVIHIVEPGFHESRLVEKCDYHNGYG